MHHAAMEARPLLVLLDVGHRKLDMGERAFENGAGDMGGGARRPIAPADEAAGETRTSSVKFATANGVALRLSSVVEGRNGAMIQPPSSAIKPSGAIWTLPSSLRVVTMHSRIIGMTA
jgi:hypothetical protein